MNNKQQIPLEGLIPGGKLYDELQPKRMKQLHCEGDCISYFYNNQLLFAKIADGQWQIQTSHSLEAVKELLGDDFTPTSTLHPIGSKAGCFWMKQKKEIVIADLLTLTILNRIVVADDWENFDYSAKARCFAYTSGNALFLLHTDGTTELVYKGSSKHILAGQAAARNEFGIEKGTFWNNSGTQLAFFITDHSHVTQYPLVDINAPIATLRNTYYPMAGKESEQTGVGIYDIRNKTVVNIEKKGRNEDYSCCITFSPTDDELLVAELDRKQQHCQLNLYCAHTGKHLRALLTEGDDKYIEPEHTPLFVGPARFVWQIRRNNYDLPYLYNLKGDYLGSLTNIEGDVTRIVGYDKTSRMLVMETNATSHTGRQIIATDMEGNVTQITPASEEATHKATLLQGGWIIDETDAPGIPYKAVLRRLDGTCEQELISSPNPLEGYAVPQIETGAMNINGYDLCYRLIKPVDFDPAKRYPMVCYFYGGPHVQLVHSDWNHGTAGFEYMMAQEGYYVFTIDPRGSAYRGKQFEQEIWRNIGAAQISDYRASVEEILAKNANNIDRERVGVYGWSFGGFISTSLKLKHGDLFKVGVAGGPVTDWKLYEAMYTERYMQTPEENAQGYEVNDLSRYVKDLEGKLMLIHCNTDPVVLWQNSLAMLKQAVIDDKQIDYGVYVGHPHNVRGPERVHLMKKVRDYFLENL